MPGRLMVGPMPLKHVIGVRIPARQHYDQHGQQNRTHEENKGRSS